MTTEIELGSEYEDQIAALVASGRFMSSDAVLKAGVGLVLEREKAFDRLRADVDAAIDDAENDRLVDLEDAFDEMDARIEAAFRDKAAAA